MKKLVVAVLLLTGISLHALAQKEKTVEVGGAAMYPSKTIVDNAIQSKDHTTLVAAVQAAGLVETLKGKGPFTVFAPTNEAFEKLPAGTVDSLLEPGSKQQLADLLKYHVVAGEVMAADVKPGKVKTVNGAEFTVATADGKVT